MSYKLSLRDVSSLKLAYNFGNFLAINPSFDFDSSSIPHPLRTKIHAGILTIAGFAGIAHTVRQKSIVFRGFEGNIITQVLDYAKILTLTCFILATIFKICIFDQDNWTNLNRNLQTVDRKLAAPKIKSGFFANTYVQIATLHMLYAGFIVAFFCLLIENLGLKMLLNIYLVPNIICYYVVYLSILVYYIVNAFKCRYQELNAIIKTNTKITSTFISEIGKLARLLNESIDEFGKVFGWALLAAITLSILQLLISLNLGIIYFKTNHPAIKTSLAYECGFFFVIMGLEILMMMSCDAAASEKSSTIGFCRKLQDRIPKFSMERKELRRLLKDLADNKSGFTAAEFLEIDRKLLLSIISTATTYFIVIIQFHQSIDK